MNARTLSAVGIIAALAIGPISASAADGQTPSASTISATEQRAAQQLARGDQDQAIKLLESELEKFPEDPALLINLGIAHAQSGNERDARTSFESAMTAPDSIDLETANGSLIDSRRLARRALTMLDRGEFRTESNGKTQVSMRR